MHDESWLSPITKERVFYMHPRFLLRKNQILGPITASFLFAKQISYNSKQTHLRFSQFLPPSFFSPPTKTGFSRPLFCNLQSVRAMASQSQSASVHDFTVKVSLILGGYGFPLKTLGDTSLVSFGILFAEFHWWVCDTLSGKKWVRFYAGVE
jgi:hypothetical protein